MARLRRADCSGPGITRRRRGRGFEYFTSGGEKVTDPEILLRIQQLAIPPAWKDVWICPHANGHLQAVGTDAAGRRQYLYHEQWRAQKDREKFDTMLEFARSLPAMRGRIAAALQSDGLGRERVLACAVRLLDLGFFRVGSEAYAEENETYGVATILKSHVKLNRNGEITFDYAAKGGTRRIQSIVDEPVYEVVRRLKLRRGGGPELLAYKEGGRWIDVRSSDINEHVKLLTQGDFSAKDFRTWNATVLAAVALAVSGGAASSSTARKRAKARVVQEVAHYLGNTPAVCRKSYIDPRVFDRYDSGWTIAGALDEIGESAGFGELSTQGAVEHAVIDLIEDRRSSPAVARIDPSYGAPDRPLGDGRVA
ncbi:MAG TPA: DNA topoisomerase IB [Actinomycetota bacterium]|jgi:DNA topoisomerase IB|nr:DNA topoisomerase IB [Actinomycetota bacterium]